MGAKRLEHPKSFSRLANSASLPCTFPGFSSGLKISGFGGFNLLETSEGCICHHREPTGKGQKGKEREKTLFCVAISSSGSSPANDSKPLPGSPATLPLPKSVRLWLVLQRWGADFSWRALQHEHPTAKNNSVNQI